MFAIVCLRDRIQLSWKTDHDFSTICQKNMKSCMKIVTRPHLLTLYLLLFAQTINKPQTCVIIWKNHVMDDTHDSWYVSSIAYWKWIILFIFHFLHLLIEKIILLIAKIPTNISCIKQLRQWHECTKKQIMLLPKNGIKYYI